MVNTTKNKKDREDKPNCQHTTDQLSAYPPCMQIDPSPQIPAEISNITTKEDRAKTEARFQQKLDGLEKQIQQELKNMREDREQVQETRNTQMMETTKEMLQNQTIAINNAINKAVKEQGTIIKNMLILECSHTDRNFDQVLQLLQAQANMNQYQMSFQQSQQMMTQPSPTMPGQIIMAQQMGSQRLQSSQSSIISHAAKNSGSYNQQGNLDNVVSPEHQPRAISIGGSHQ
eukprot:9648535-Ditylum_brightwellii.AAC.3